MSNYTYQQIKKIVFEWSQNDISKELSKNDLIEITKNENHVLLIDLTFDSCLAQIVVSNTIYAPYQYVSLEAMTFDSQKAQESGKPEMVYFFYDSDEMLKNEVLDELSFGVKLCSKYIPDQLSKMYLDKIGLLNMKNENLSHVLHPDDIKKYDKNLMTSNFICVGAEAQYLVVRNDLITLRVLPQIFTLYK